MSLVVADTGPLRYLIAVDAIGHLPRLYPQVLVPPTVVAELRHAHAPLVVRQWAQTLPAWIGIQRPNLPHDPQRLDPGEAEALGLALQIRASVVLLDEMEARREAVRLGLSITGTVGILERMAKRGLLNLEEAFSRLTATNYRIERHYLDDALKRARLHGRSREP